MPRAPLAERRAFFAVSCPAALHRCPLQPADLGTRSEAPCRASGTCRVRAPRSLSLALCGPFTGAVELFGLPGSSGLPDAGPLLCGPALSLHLAVPWPFMAGRLAIGDALIDEAAAVDQGAMVDRVTPPLQICSQTSRARHRAALLGHADHPALARGRGRGHGSPDAQPISSGENSSDFRTYQSARHIRSTPQNPKLPILFSRSISCHLSITTLQALRSVHSYSLRLRTQQPLRSSASVTARNVVFIRTRERSIRRPRGLLIKPLATHKFCCPTQSNGGILT